MPVRRLILRLFNALRPGRAEPDLAREIASHLELLEDDFRRRGLAGQEARLAALRAFGSTAAAMDRHRDTRALLWLDDARRDVRQAVRSLRRSPAFAIVAVLTIALGIGATTAMFSLIDEVLLRSLPVRDPGRLVVFGDARGSGTAIGRQGGSFTLFSFDLYRRLRDERVVDSLCAVGSSATRINVRRPGQGDGEAAIARLVSTNYFDVLGTTAAAGRLLGPADEAPASPPVAVVSYRFWTDRLNRDPAIVGSSIRMDRLPVTIIGVAAPEFFGETLEPEPPAFWMPLALDRRLDPSRSVIDSPDVHWLYLVGRIAPAASLAEAQAHATTALRDWLRDRGGAALSSETEAEIAATRIELRPGDAGIPHARREYGSALHLLLAIAAIVLLIACANVANLLLARGAARETERAIRLAIGASRGRLVRQLLAESLTIALAGGALGLLLASWAVQLLLALMFENSGAVPFSTTLNANVVGFALIVSCVSAIGFGVLPAIRGSAKPGGHEARGIRWGRTLIVSQAALSLVVLAAAGALARSAANLGAQGFGFEPTRVLVINVDPARAGYTVDRLGPLYRALRDRLEATPGVATASLSYYSPFDECCWAFTIAAQGYAPPADGRRSALLDRVSPGYFQTIGTRLVRGRSFDDRDGPSAPRVAVVNGAFARRYFEGADPIGRRFSIGDGGPPGALEIVGMVEDAKYHNPREAARPMAFLPLLQPDGDQTDVEALKTHFIRTIEVRTTADPGAVAGAVRVALAEVDPNLPVMRVATLSTQIDRAINGEQVVASLAAVFGVVALALTCVGLYGLASYDVQQRTREIGIRMALGAERSRVVAMVVREILAQGAIGALLGVPAAWMAIRLIRSALFGISPADIRDPLLAGGALIACLIAAGCIPARRASRIEPIEALRQA